MRSGFGWGFIFSMTYTITIDQCFAKANNLTLVQACALSTCLSLLHWSETIAIDGKVWYQYSEQKISEDYPLLFGCTKRVYKNFQELEIMGLIETIKISRKKYLRITDKCASWNQIRTDGPKLDQKESENGLKNGPNLDSNYNINLNYNINDYNINTETKVSRVSSEDEEGDKSKKTLFRNSDIYALVTRDGNCNADYTRFIDKFDKEFQNIDLIYYFHAVCDWSEQKGMKRTARGWLATIRNFIRLDNDRGTLHVLTSTQEPQMADMFQYLNNDY